MSLKQESSIAETTFPNVSQVKSRSKLFSDSVDRILYAVESRSDNAIGGGKRRGHICYGGQLTESDLHHLSLLCSSIDNDDQPLDASIKEPLHFVSEYNSPGDSPSLNTTLSGWASIDVDTISALTFLLEEHVTSAIVVDLVGEVRRLFEDRNDNLEQIDEWQTFTENSTSTGYHRLSILRHGLEAASILLSIMTSPRIDRRIVSATGIAACLSLLRNHILNNAIPALSNLGHSASYSNINPTTRDGGVSPSSPYQKRVKENHNQIDSQITNLSSKKKKKKVSGRPSDDHQQQLIRVMKRIYPHILSTIGILSLLMERIDVLIRRVPLDDEPLMSISSVCLSTFEIDPVSVGIGCGGTTFSLASVIQLTNVIQIASITLISSIFQRYEYHRDIILEDLVPVLVKVPTSKKSMRTFPVYVSSIANTQTSKKGNQIDPPSNIQMTTALILHLFQSCVTIPQLSEKILNTRESKNEHEEEIPQSTPAFRSGLERCESACRTFTREIVKRCAKKGDDGGASEYRSILSNLVDDLLHVQTMPQFPCAEMILFSLSMRLSNDLILNTTVVRNESSNNTIAEATYLKTATDTLGKIYSDVAMKIVSCRKNPLEFPRPVDIEDKDHKDQFRCFCGREGLVDTFMLDCDRCHGWFHGSCIGIPKDKLPEIWTCDECTMQMLVLEQANAITNKSSREGLENEGDVFKNLGKEDEVYIMRILLLNYLDEKRLKNPTIENARHFHLARFIRDMEKLQQIERKTEQSSCLLHPGLVSNQFLQMWDLNDFVLPENGSSSKSLAMSGKYRNCEYLTEEGNSKLMLTLFVSRSELAGSLPKLIEILLRLAGDDTVMLRKFALKAMGQIVQADPTVMSRSVILNVIKRFQDEAISVREEAIALVGLFIMNDVPNHFKVFHKPLLGMLDDVGVSVRKRCVRIIRNILLMENIQCDSRAYICTALLTRAANPKEDEGIRDLIHETFHVLWFENFEYSFKLPTKVTHDIGKQMVDVVSTSQSTDYLAALLKEYLFGLSEMGNRKKSSNRMGPDDVRKYCSNIVASLIEQLISYEEKSSQQDHNDDKGQHLHAILLTLSVFAEALPSLLLKDLETLFPLLKANNNASRENEALIVSTVCKIISLVSNCLSEIDIRRLGLGDLPKDLVGITYKFGSDTTTRAIETLSKLAFQSGQREDEHMSSELLKLTKLFASCLIKHKDSAADFSKIKSIKVRDNIRRSLFAIGSICRFCTKDYSLDFDFELDTSIALKHSDLTWDNLHASMFNIFYRYLQNNDVAIKCEALGAMSGVFLSRPRILLAVEEEGILEKVLSTNSDIRLQVKSLECWRDILLAEEVRVDSGEAKRQMEAKQGITLSKRISGDQDGDASLIGACCTQHSSRLLEMLSCKEYAIRLKSLLLIEILLRQGLINPMETVPHLLALQGDVNFPNLRSMALKMLVEEGQRRPDMIRQRLPAGMKRSYQFQRKVYSSQSKVTALIPDKSDGKLSTECIFGQIFRDAIRGSRSHSIRVLSSLLGIFRKSKEHSEESYVDKVPLLCFTAEMLAYLPYNHLGDVLFIIYNISNILTLETNDYNMRFIGFVREFGVNISDEEDFASMDNHRKVFSPIFSKGVFSADTLQKFAELCAEASSFLLMLRLKYFLREAYSGLTEHRLREYLPNEKERIADRKVIMLEVQKFDSYIESLFDSNGAFDKDSLVRQYMSFRKLLAEDEGSTSDDDDYNDGKESHGTNKRKRGQFLGD